MPKTEPEIHVNFRLLGIEVLSSQLCFPELKAIQTKEFKFNVESNAGFNVEENQVFVNIAVKILDEEMKTLFGSIQTGFSFELLDLKNLIVKDENGKVDLPVAIIEILNSVSLSTTRGIMFSRFMGTYLNGAFLPIVDPKILTASRKDQK